MPTPLRPIMILDKSGNGLNGLSSGGLICEEDGPVGRKQIFYGKGEPILGVVTNALFNDQLDTTWVLTEIAVKSLGEGNVGTVFSVDDGGTQYTWLRTINNGGNVYSYQVLYDDLVAEWQWDIPVLGVDHTMIIEHLNKNDPNEDPVVHIDNQSVTVTNISRSAGNLVSDAGASIIFGNESLTGAAAFDGCLMPFKFFDRELTTAEKLEQYLEAALRVRDIGWASRYQYPITLVSITNERECGPFYVLDGTWDWEDNNDDARRLLAGGVNPTCVLPVQGFAYGGFYFRASRTATGDIFVGFIANARTGRVTPQDSYELRLMDTGTVRLARRNGGAQVVLVDTLNVTVADTVYEFFVARRVTDSRFAIYIRGGAYATWTLLNTATNGTVTTSKLLYIDGDVNTGGAVAGPFRIYPRGGGMHPNDDPALADAA